MRLKHIGYLEWVFAFAIFGARSMLHRGLLDTGVAYPIMFSALFMLVACWYLKRSRYRPYIYEPIQPDALPRSYRKTWDQTTNYLELLGFRQIGDFKLQDEPRETLVRYFLCDDPRIRAEIGAIEDEITPSFCTVFEDGRMIESAIHPTTQTKCDPDENLWFITQPSGTLGDALDRHRRAIDMYEQETGFAALAVTPDRLYEFAQYGHRLVWWSTRKSPRHLGPPSPPGRVPEQQYATAS